MPTMSLQVEWLTDANISTVPVRAVVRVWPKGRDAFAEDYSSPVDFDGSKPSAGPGVAMQVAAGPGGAVVKMKAASGDQVKIQVTKRKQVHTVTFNRSLSNRPVRISTTTTPTPLVVMLTVDISGSMTGARIRVAIAGVKKVLMSLCPEDIIAILTFNTKVHFVQTMLSTCVTQLTRP